MSQLRGGKELQDLLSQLPAKIEANVVRGGLRKGAVVLRDAIREAAPKDSGDLAASVRVSVRLRNGTVVATVKTGNKKAWYAHLVEYGTAAHEIHAAEGGRLAIGGALLTFVNHPGARAHPFVRPALDSHQQIALDAAMDYMRNRLKTKYGLETPDPDAVLDNDES